MSMFYIYFRENMAALQLPAPQSLFSTAKQVRETITDIAGAIRTFGLKATLGEIILTIPSLSAAGDLLTLGYAISAVYYVGACIGSAAVALGRSASGGGQILDFFEVGRELLPDQHLLLSAFHEYCRRGGHRHAARPELTRRAS